MSDVVLESRCQVLPTIVAVDNTEPSLPLNTDSVISLLSGKTARSMLLKKGRR